jgi:hypothetical protein
MRFLIVILVFLGLISPANAQWLRSRKDRDRPRGKPPQKEPRRRADRPREALPAAAIARRQPVVSELGVRARSQLHRDLDRVSQSVRSVFSPDRQHIVQVRSFGHGTVVMLDGRRIHPRQGVSRLVGLPSFSPDGRSLAFLERVGREQRLVVVADISEPDDVLSWRIPEGVHSQSAPLPGRAGQAAVTAAQVKGDRVFWADNRRITVGEEILKPRAQVRLTFATQGAE